MCRYLMTQQFLGITFANLIEENLFDIDISVFNLIEKKVDKFIRKKNNAMMCVSLVEIYSTVEEYNDFFQVTGSKIKLIDDVQKKLKKDIEKEKFISTLNDYFSAGIPEDINESLNTILRTELKR